MSKSGYTGSMQIQKTPQWALQRRRRYQATLAKILNDNPRMTRREAVKLARKMVSGRRGSRAVKQGRVGQP